MPLLAALIVAVVSSSLVTILSKLGVPVSVVVISTMSIVGLGWGRATRVVSLSQTMHGETAEMSLSMQALATDADDAPTVGGEGGTPQSTDPPSQIGEEEPTDTPRAADLFDPASSLRVIIVQNIVPALATIAAYLLFRFVPVV